MPRFRVVLIGAMETHGVNRARSGEDLDLLHPGKAPDTAGLTDGPETFAELAVREIKNRCLATFSVLDYCIWAIVTNEDHAENWAFHIVDSLARNSLTNTHLTQFASVQCRQDDNAKKTYPRDLCETQYV